MTISVEEVFETIRMVEDQHLDIRTTTIGVNLKDCIRENFGQFCKEVQK
jgi:uncharacterized protein (UPF0210 family)